MFFKQFAYLFSNMEWFVIVTLVLGFVLLLIEIFQPGFGIFGLFGVIFLVATIILRAVFNAPEDVIIVQIFWMVLIEFLVIGSSFGFLLLAHKKGWLKRSPFVLNGTAVNEDFSEGTENYSDIAGMVGLAITDLRPSGKIQIGDQIYDVTAENFFIEKRKEVTVISIEGRKITVKEKFE